MIVVGDLILDRDTLTIRHARTKKTGGISGRRAAILERLLSPSGKLVSAEAMAAVIWPGHADVCNLANKVSHEINRLREQLADIGLQHVIHTRHRAGWFIALPERETT